MVIQLRVNLPSAEEKIIDLCDNEAQMKKITVKQLKQIIKQKFTTTDDNWGLVVGTEYLDDDALLVSYRIKHMSTIHTALQLPGGI